MLQRLHYLNLFTPVELVDGEVLPAHGQRPLVDLGQLLLLHHVGEAATLFHDWQLRKKISITLGLVKTEPFQDKAFISSTKESKKETLKKTILLSFLSYFIKTSGNSTYFNKEY